MPACSQVAARAGHHQRARAVVQERRIGDPQLCSERDVVLVARAADGVEAAVRLLELACGNVELARQDLVLEQLDRLARRQSAPRAQRRIARQHAGRVGGGREIGVERGLDDGDTIEGHARDSRCSKVGVAGGLAMIRAR